MRSPRTTYICLLIGAMLWCFGFALAPVAASGLGKSSFVSQTLYALYHPVCHQFAFRSFHILGEPLAVCERCCAIYAAFLAGTIFYPLICRVNVSLHPPRWVLIATVLPMVIDAVAGTAGLHTATWETRLVTGALFGTVLPLFILPIILQGFQPDPSATNFVHHLPMKGANHA